MRTGEMSGISKHGIEPDILVTGKGLSGGMYPITAAILGDRAAQWLDEDGFAHISTFGGAELGCVAAIKTLEITRRPEVRSMVHYIADRSSDRSAPDSGRRSRLVRRHPAERRRDRIGVRSPRRREVRDAGTLRERGMGDILDAGSPCAAVQTGPAAGPRHVRGRVRPPRRRGRSGPALPRSVVGGERVIQDDIAVAERALAEYDLAPHSALSLLNLSENATYAVEDAGTGTRSILRVHRQNYHLAHQIESELDWLDALRRDSDVTVPTVLPATDGRRVVTVNVDGIPRYVVHFEMVAGVEPDEASVTVEDFRTLGWITAVLHEHSHAWTRPPGFSRFSWDWEHSLGDESRWGRWQDADGVGGQKH